MNNENEILTIAGEQVKVRYSVKVGDCCYKCCFWSDAYGMCRAERADSTPPCPDYDSKEGGFAYFVRVKESQTTNAKEDKREFCKDNCKGYQETGRCFADGDCKAKQEAESKASVVSETDFEAEYTRYMESRKDDVSGHAVTINIKDVARHFAEWERKRILDKSVEWMKANLTYIHPRKGNETCMVNIPAFLDAMNEENT